MIYLDNAATSWPKPQTVYDTLGSFLQDAGANPGRAGHRMAVAASAAIAETRLALARLLNAPSPSRVIFTSSATDGLNLAILGLLRPGDHAITTTMEHNSVSRPLSLAVDAGAEVTKVPATPNGVVQPEDIARRNPADDPPHCDDARLERHRRDPADRGSRGDRPGSATCCSWWTAPRRLGLCRLMSRPWASICWHFQGTRA